MSSSSDAVGAGGGGGGGGGGGLVKYGELLILGYNGALPQGKRNKIHTSFIASYLPFRAAAKKDSEFKFKKSII